MLVTLKLCGIKIKNWMHVDGGLLQIWYKCTCFFHQSLYHCSFYCITVRRSCKYHGNYSIYELLNISFCTKLTSFKMILNLSFEFWGTI